MSRTSESFDYLLDPILRQLRARPAGATEFDLLRALDAAGVEPFASAQLNEPLGLYRSHFILFHCLYRLQQRLHEQGEDLEVHCLNIRLGRRRDSEAVPGRPDPLRGFYLDLANLHSVNAADVEAMLGSFWQRFERTGGTRRREALAVLELSDPVSRDDIKRQYRRLAMRHHPDRGGDTGKLQELNEALSVLVP